MFHLVMVYTVSKHKTESAARRALKQLQGSKEDIAMVVQMPEGTKPPPSYKEKSNDRRSRR